MVTQNELKVFYETNLKSKLLFFEEQRKLLVSKRRTLWNIFWILVIFAILVVIIALSLKDTREVLIGTIAKTASLRLPESPAKVVMSPCCI
jgi:type IV secretory pathway component VirB8